MLTAAQFDSLVVPILDMYEEFTQSVINDIARRIVKMGSPTATSAWQVQRIIESGLTYQDTIRRISLLTGKSERQLKEIFKQSGVKAVSFDDKIYREAGLDPIPLNLSPAMLDVLTSGLIKTGGVMKNLTMTTATSSQQLFIQGADLAYNQVIHGTMSYDQAVRSSIKHIGDSGLNVHYPTGHKDKLDVAMRRTVLTGVGQTAAQLQLTRADQLGQDLVQISAHGGARPSHAKFQGQIFSRSGRDKHYPDFVSSTGYGSGQGLAGYNCRHSFYPFFKGISENAYTEDETDKLAREKVKYRGQSLSMFDATQEQRRIERKIRSWTRDAEVCS